MIYLGFVRSALVQRVPRATPHPHAHGGGVCASIEADPSTPSACLSIDDAAAVALVDGPNPAPRTATSLGASTDAFARELPFGLPPVRTQLELAPIGVHPRALAQHEIVGAAWDGLPCVAAHRFSINRRFDDEVSHHTRAKLGGARGSERPLHRGPRRMRKFHQPGRCISKLASLRSVRLQERACLLVTSPRTDGTPRPTPRADVPPSWPPMPCESARVACPATPSRVLPERPAQRDGLRVRVVAGSRRVPPRECKRRARVLPVRRQVEPYRPDVMPDRSSTPTELLHGPTVRNQIRAGSGCNAFAA